MTALRLRLRAEPAQRLDLSVLTPDRLAGLDEAEIARLPLATTREPAFVGDLFDLRMGDAADIVIEGGSARLDCVGAGMWSGELRIDGEVGLDAGRLMRGGRLTINGDAGPRAASGLRGGDIVIAGNAGPWLAGPGPGEHAGMAGGTVVVRGGVGPGVAMRMRRGTVVVEGDAGAEAARSMIAGTVVICGRALGCPGLMMRRGSIVLGHSVALGAGFVPAGSASAVFLALLAEFVRSLSTRAASLLGGPVRRMAGDLAVGGQGEILDAGRPGRA